MEAESKLIERQEMERLLYVALTRAKHTLVLANAPGLYATSKNPQPSKSQIKWLRCEDGGCNRGAFSSLGNEALAEPATASHQKTKDKERSRAAKVPALPTVWPGSGKIASDFVRKISPSGLAEAFSAESARDLEQLERMPVRAGAFDNAATRYGNWWHQLLQRFDWQQSPREWEGVFRSSLYAVTERAQTEREWKLFLDHIEGENNFRKHLGSNSFIAHSEMPFLLKMGQTAALEGVIDLLLLAPDSRRALIIDWKSNAIKPDRVASLRGKYQSQLAAYWKAVRELTDFEVEAGLYAIATGDFLLFSASELETEWDRLANLPSQRLEEEIGLPDF